MNTATQNPQPTNGHHVDVDIHRPIADIVPSKTNPRKLFPADPEFIESIKRHGVIQPLLVRPHTGKPGSVFEIVAGERRWRAAKEAGLTTVPVMIRALSDDETLEIQIVENLQRRDLTPLEEAEGYNVLLKAKYTYERIAEKIGRSRQYVFDRCALLKLVKGAAELLRNARIEVGHAILLARLSPEDQVRAIRPPGDGYGPERHSGLWQRQRDLPMTSIEAKSGRGHGEEEDLKPVSVRELAAWIQDHVRLKPEASENAELFPEVAQALAEAPFQRGKRVGIIEITLSHQLNDDTRDPKKRVYGAMLWTRADGKAGSKECANSVVGVVVAGDGQGEAFRVCVDKAKCQVHYKQQIADRAKREKAVAKSGKTGADRAQLEAKKRQAEEEKAKAARASFERAIPAIRVAVFEKALRASLSDHKDTILKSLDWGVVEGVKAVGSQLTPGKSSDDFIRYVGVGAAVGYLYRHQPDRLQQDHVEKICKRFGIDVAKLLQSTNANEAASAEARKPKSAAKSKRAGKK